MFENLLDAAYRAALDNGDFDDLPGTGKPLDPASFNTDPFAHVCREGEVMTPFGTFQRQIDAARARLAAETDPGRRRAIQAGISALITRKAVEMETFRRYG